MSEYSLRGDRPPLFDARSTKVGGSWKYNALAATQANRTVLGMIICSMLGQVAENPPRIVSSAEIGTDGMVYALYQARSMGTGQAGMAQICSAEELRDDFRRLSDFLNLNEFDRELMNRELRTWIKLDHRVQVDLGLPNANLKEV